MFKYEHRPDLQITRRLEVTLFFNGANDKGVVVYSKNNGMGYPHKNWKAFDQRVMQAIKDNKIEI